MPPPAPARVPPEDASRVQRLRAIATLLDAAFGIPGTRLRFGADAILGLIPGLGDAVGFALASAIVWEAARRGASTPVILRMLYNAGVDVLVGAAPVVGDFSDVLWKANLQNVALLERQVADPAGTQRASGWLLAGVGLTLLTLTAGSLALGVWLMVRLVGWLL